MTDFEMLKYLMKKGGMDIAAYEDKAPENEINIYLGEFMGYGVSFFFNQKTGELLRCEE